MGKKHELKSILSFLRASIKMRFIILAIWTTNADRRDHFDGQPAIKRMRLSIVLINVDIPIR